MNSEIDLSPTEKLVRPIDWLLLNVQRAVFQY